MQGPCGEDEQQCLEAHLVLDLLRQSASLSLSPDNSLGWGIVNAEVAVAAAIAVEAGDLPTARQHIEALTLIEPDRPQHQKRLETIDRLMEN